VPPLVAALPWPPPCGRHYGEEKGGAATQAPSYGLHPHARPTADAMHPTQIWPPPCRRFPSTFSRLPSIAAQASYGLRPNVRAGADTLPPVQIWSPPRHESWLSLVCRLPSATTTGRRDGKEKEREKREERERRLLCSVRVRSYIFQVVQPTVRR
jgi:hypothetical protein